MRLDHRPRKGDDSGQVMLLVVGLAVILFMLISVVAGASKVFLAQRSLSSAADGAAVAAASSVSDGVVYTGDAVDVLPLADAGVRAAAGDYAVAAGLAERFQGFALTAPTGSADGRTATVSMRARVPVPFLSLLPSPWQAGVPIAVTANARAPLDP